MTNATERQVTDPRRFERRRLRWVPVGIALLALLTLVGVLGFDSPGIYLYNSILLACIGAIALNMLMGTAGLVSMGSAAFLALGAFGTVFLQSLGLPSVLAVVVAALVSALLGLIVGLPALRLRGLELALASIAAFFIVLFVVREYQTATVGAGGFIFRPWFSEAGLVGSQRVWAWVLFGVVSLLLVFANLTITRRFGRALRLIRDHEIAAHALGYRVTRYKMTIFVISSGLIGLQGALTASLTGVVGVDNFTILVSILYLQMILIGGLDSLLGSVIGAAIVVSLPLLTQEVVTTLWSSPSAAVASAQIAVVISGALVIIFVVGAPDGLVGVVNKIWTLISAPLRRRAAAAVSKSGDGRQAAATTSDPAA